jgi:hypothetical protein
LKAVFTAPTNTGIPLSGIIVALTVPQLETLTTGSQSKALENLIVDLSSEVGVEVVTDADVSSAFTNEIEVQAGMNAEAASIDLTVQEFEFSVESALDAVVIDLTVDIDTDAFVTVDLSPIIVDLTNTLESEVAVNAEPVSIALSLEEFEIEAGGNLDIPGIDLTLDIETDDEALAGLETLVIDLTLDIGIESDFDAQLETITVELSNDLDLQLEAGLGSLSMTAEVIESIFEVGGNVIPISNDLELEDFQLNSDVITSSLTADLVAEFIALQVGGDIDAVDINLSLTTASDAELNIQLPANMEAAQGDDPTTVT